MIKTLNQIEAQRETERMFKKRDPEGKFIFNNVLLNGHVDMLEYLLEHWAEAHANLPLTLEGNTTVLHQALCKAAFCKSESFVKKEALKIQNNDEVAVEFMPPQQDHHRNTALSKAPSGDQV